MDPARFTLFIRNCLIEAYRLTGKRPFKIGPNNIPCLFADNFQRLMPKYTFRSYAEPVFVSLD